MLESAERRKVRLISCEIIFRVFQDMWPRYFNFTDRWIDRRQLALAILHSAQHHADCDMHSVYNTRNRRNTHDGTTPKGTPLWTLKFFYLGHVKKSMYNTVQYNTIASCSKSHPATCLCQEWIQDKLSAYTTQEHKEYTHDNSFLEQRTIKGERLIFPAFTTDIQTILLILDTNAQTQWQYHNAIVSIW